MRGARLAAALNLTKAVLLLAGLAAAAGGFGWLLGGYRLLLLFATSVVLAAAAVYWHGDRVVLGMTRAREVPLAEAPRVHSALERLAARAGVVKPRLYLLDDGYPRAFAVGRGPAGSAIAVSRGLLSAAPPAELDGLLAHELAHVRSHDVLVQTVAVVLAATLIELSRIGGFLQRGLLFVLAPIASAFVHALLSPKREFAADREAARLCESPHGLAAALLRLEQASELLTFRESPATEPLYPLNPFDEEDRVGALFATHPPLGERVRRLRALDPDWRANLRAA
ncbi:MAG: M48 family metalloprotease [Thermoleophilia bacterium]|nr:M48 family metalloprotease [Thermoleophilia bacterium]